MTYEIEIYIPGHFPDSALLCVELDIGLPTRPTYDCPGDGGSVDVDEVTDDQGNTWTMAQANLLVAWSTLLETGNAVTLDEHIEAQWDAIMERAGDQWISDRDDAMVDRWESQRDY
jgi:hypothetical protein